MFAFHINPGDVLHLSWSRKLHLSSIQVTNISRSSGFKVVCHTSIQVLSHLHPGPNNLISPPSMSQHHPGPKLRVSAASILRLTCIQVIIFAHSSIHILSQPNPGVHISVWTPSRYVSPPARFHLTLGLQMYISPPYSCISTPSRLRLIPVQVMIVAPHLHPGRVPSPLGWRDLQLSPIHVPPHSSFYILSKVYCDMLTKYKRFPMWEAILNVNVTSFTDTYCTDVIQPSESIFPHVIAPIPKY